MLFFTNTARVLLLRRLLYWVLDTGFPENFAIFKCSW